MKVHSIDQTKINCEIISTEDFYSVHGKYKNELFQSQLQSMHFK